MSALNLNTEADLQLPQLHADLRSDPELRLLSDPCGVYEEEHGHRESCVIKLNFKCVNTRCSLVPDDEAPSDASRSIHLHLKRRFRRAAERSGVRFGAAGS